MLHCGMSLVDERSSSYVVHRSNAAPGRAVCFLGRFLPKLGGAARRRHFFVRRIARRPCCARSVLLSEPRSAGGYSPRPPLAGRGVSPHAPGMFVVSEAEAAAIRTVFEQRGELSAAIELRRLFPGITDNAQARACARTIAGWKPLSAAPRRRRSQPGGDRTP